MTAAGAAGLSAARCVTRASRRWPRAASAARSTEVVGTSRKRALRRAFSRRSSAISLAGAAAAAEAARAGGAAERGGGGGRINGGAAGRTDGGGTAERGATEEIASRAFPKSLNNQLPSPTARTTLLLRCMGCRSFIPTVKKIKGNSTSPYSRSMRKKKVESAIYTHSYSPFTLCAALFSLVSDRDKLRKTGKTLVIIKRFQTAEERWEL